MASCRSAASGGLVLAFMSSLSTGLYITPDAVDGTLLDSYDYVIVGGGASGLVVANRLTEDPSVTVLVLEAGQLDTEGYTVMIPSEVGADVGGEYDWSLHTQPQTYLDGHRVTLNQGKAIGGGTILNGMVWTRGSSSDFDTWDDLNTNSSESGDSTRYGWRWSDLLPYFMRSENFGVDVGTYEAMRLEIYPELDFHGLTGSVSVAYPEFFYSQASNFLQGMQQMGIPSLTDPNNGTGAGVFIAPSSMSAKNQSRCDARIAYFDPSISRSNLHVATNQTVTRLLFETSESQTLLSPGPGPAQQATGVEFASSDQGPRATVNCTRELIMASGAIFTPTLLQISGIGPRKVLESLNVSVLVDLPGVGANMNDHGMIHPIYSYTNSSLLTASKVTDTPEILAQAQNDYYTNRTGPLTAPMISTIAFPSMSQLAEDWVALIGNASQSDINDTLPAGTDPAVQQGYLAQRAAQIPLLQSPDQTAVEFLADSIGTLSIAMQRPLSRGTVRPSSTDVFDQPLVDPRYCSEPFDCLVLARALLFNCALIRTYPMAELQPVVQEPYFCPPAPASSASNSSTSSGGGGASRLDPGATNDQMLQLVKENIVTEFHPSGTTAMMPLDLGGVVDTSLKVYGTTNVRVVDAGMMPLVVGAHLQAAVYAIAERAADIIKDAQASTRTTPRCSRAAAH